jgi:hypothetical protein
MASDIYARSPLIQPSTLINGTLVTFPFSANTQAVAYLFEIEPGEEDVYTTIYLNKQSGGGVGQTYRPGLKLFDNASGAVILGGSSWLGAGGGAYADTTNPSNGINILTLGEGASLSPGVIYAVSLECTAGIPNAVWTLGQQFNNLLRYPYCATYNGTTWSFSGASPMVGVASAQFCSAGFYATGTSITVANNSEIASTIHLPVGAGQSWTMIGVEVYASSLTAAGEIQLLYYPGTATTDTTGTLLRTVPGGALARPAVNPWRFMFSTPQVITPGSDGRLSLKNLTGSNLFIPGMDYPDTFSMRSQAGGSDVYASSRTTGNWTNTLQRKLSLVPIYADVTAPAGGGLLTPAGMLGGMRG